MNDKELEKAIMTAAIEVAKDRAEDLYKDGAQGAVKESGEALQAIVGLFNNVVLHPIKLANINFRYKLEQFEEDLRSKVSKIPEVNLVEPDISISGPTIEALKYTFDKKELREMYLNLLSSAMNSDLSSEVHPAFVEIIRGMGALDAVVFKEISKTHQFPVSYLRLTYGDKYLPSAVPSMFAPDLLEYGDPFLISKSLVNLGRLGLVENTPMSFITAVDYKSHIQHEFIQSQLNLYKIDDPARIYSITSDGNGLCRITDLGRSVSKCCLEE